MPPVRRPVEEAMTTERGGGAHDRRGRKVDTDLGPVRTVTESKGPWVHLTCDNEHHFQYRVEVDGCGVAYRGRIWHIGQPMLDAHGPWCPSCGCDVNPGPSHETTIHKSPRL